MGSLHGPRRHRKRGSLLLLERQYLLRCGFHGRSRDGDTWRVTGSASDSRAAQNWKTVGTRAFPSFAKEGNTLLAGAKRAKNVCPLLSCLPVSDCESRASSDLCPPVT